MTTLQTMLAENAPRKHRNLQPEHVPLNASASRIPKMSPRYRDRRVGDPYSWTYETSQTLEKAIRIKAQSSALREQSDVARASVERQVAENRTTVSEHLKKRIAELEGVVQEFDTQVQKITDEMQRLEAAREKAVAMYNARQGPLKVAESRLLVRSQRPQRELINDPVETALEHEAKDIQDGLEQLSNCSKTALVQLHKLEEQRAILAEEFDMKQTALDIDKQCLQVEYQHIHKKSIPVLQEPEKEAEDNNDDISNLSEDMTIGKTKLKSIGKLTSIPAGLAPTNPVGVRAEINRAGRPKLHMHTPRFLVTASEVQKTQWRASAEAMLHTAQEVIQQSDRIRKSIRKVIQGIAQSNEDNLSATTEALIEKVDMTHQLQSRLQDQLETVDVELESLLERREKLVADIRHKEGPLNIARQRLALRRSRPARELVRDSVELALEQEIEEVQKCVSTLEKKLDAIEIEEKRLRETKTKLESDLADKQAALQLDRQCLEIDVDNVDKQGIPLQSRPEGGDMHAASVYPTAMSLVGKFASKKSSTSRSNSSANIQPISPRTPRKKGNAKKSTEGIMSPTFMRSPRAAKDHSRRRWPKYGFAKDPMIPTHVKKELLVNFSDLAGGSIVDNYKHPAPPPVSMAEE
eukprot:TRINITY_DN21451_c0_g1_i1.p1 TRINITY_DN21451_c0_g1~~TRINITY_DN21451_c0_g1_i1.p1  ORF type:complete len:637 (-),score=32.52 TRINITY_DN21451_c0_g1_i1:101-2011(-)